MRSWSTLSLALLVRAIVNPRVARDLLALAWSMRQRDWYRTAPFLPLPPPEYVRWRMYTAYGDEHAVPSADDVLRVAHWRRDLLRP